jgi:hypothetical protein
MRFDQADAEEIGNACNVTVSARMQFVIEVDPAALWWDADEIFYVEALKEAAREEAERIVREQLAAKADLLWLAMDCEIDEVEAEL